MPHSLIRFSYDNNNDSWHLQITIKKFENGSWIVFGDEYLKRKY